jgi:hypothetical protein
VPLKSGGAGESYSGNRRVQNGFRMRKGILSSGESASKLGAFRADMEA